jgi:type II secretory pathway pseudopilin PulG
MSQTFAINKNENENQNEIKCCVCYDDDNSEEGNKGKLIECCPNKHVLCIECFHKSYERKCECPLCRELMYKPEIMTDNESLAYFVAKVALNQKREREEQQRERQRAEAERQRVEAERRRAEALARLQIRKTERIQIIQRRNDELMRQIATNNAEIENINNLELDAYNATYPPNFEPRTTTLNNIISDSDSHSDNDSDSDSDVDIIYYMGPAPTTTPVQQQVAARPVQQPVARPVTVTTPVQQPVARPVTVTTPVQQPVARPVQQPVARPITTSVQQPVARPVQQPVARPVQQPVARPITTSVQQPVARPPVAARQRKSSTYAKEKLENDTILVQTLWSNGHHHRMEVKYDRLNNKFIRLSNNAIYSTLNKASAAHAQEAGYASTPNPWTTFKKLDGSSIDNL